MVRRLWQEDLERQADWQVAERNWTLAHKPPAPPLSLATLPRETQQYYERSLKPLLNSEEEKRLKDAERPAHLGPRGVGLIEPVDANLALAVVAVVGGFEDWRRFDAIGAALNEKGFLTTDGH